MISTPVKIFAFLGLGAIFVLFFQPMVNRAPGNARRSACQSNLKQIGIAAQQYAADYDYLPAHTDSLGWGELLEPYLSQTSTLQCPSDTNKEVPLKPYLPGYSDYWMNGNCQGHVPQLYTYDYSAHLILFGDGDGNSPQSSSHYALRKLPAHWRKDEDSPAQRHLGTANYCFLDGHAKALRPPSIYDKAPGTAQVGPVYFLNSSRK